MFVLVPTLLMAVVLIHELPRLKGFRTDVVGGRVQRGVGAPLLGVLADAHGLNAVFETIAVLPLLALGLTLALPTRVPSGSEAVTADRRARTVVRASVD